MDQIEHFIVLVLENRSFDHMLGYLDHPNTEFDGAGRVAGTLTTPNARYAIYPGPDHSHTGVMQQLFNVAPPPSPPYQPTMMGFAASYDRQSPGHGEKILRCFDPRMVPVISKLAIEFAVCDRWFCSLPGETFPNRDFVHAGTSFGQVGCRIRPILSNPPTVFSMLEHVGKSWRAYHSGVAHCLLYAQLFLGRDRQGSHNRLLSDIATDNLPSYAFVEPDYGLPGRGNSQHPSQARSREEFVDGEAMISRIYETLRAKPSVFEKTAFIITYDEHGGFYDHVPVAQMYSPNDDASSIYHDGAYSFGFQLSGPRVPAIVVSPWIAPNTVSHTERDHSCIGETVRQRWGKDIAYPLNDRAEPMSLEELFTLDQPRRGADLPATSPLSYAQAEALERELSAPPDETDENPVLDVSHQTAMNDLTDWLRSHGLHF